MLTISFATGLVLAAWAFYLHDQTLVGGEGFVAAALLLALTAASLTGKKLGNAPLRVIFFAATLGPAAGFAILASNYYPAEGSTSLVHVPIVERTTIGRKHRPMLVVNLAGHRKLLGEYPGDCTDKSRKTAVVTIQDGLLGFPVIRAHRCE